MQYLLLLLLVGCVTTESVNVSISLPEDAPDPLMVRVRAGLSADACPSRPPTEQESLFQEGMSTPRIGELREGRTVFVADAWDSRCERCFFGCAAIEVGQDTMVRLRMDEAACDDLCERGDAGVDASQDAGTDVETDGFVDAVADGATDTTVDTSIDDALTDIPDAADAGPRAIEVAAGAEHNCAIREDGRVFCWGANQGMQAGSDERSVVPSPTPINSTEMADQLSLGQRVSCGRFAGRVQCWGNGGGGDYGLGTDLTTRTPTPVAVAGLPDLDVADIATGWRHACVSLVDQRVYCWGRSASGELGSCCDAPVPRATEVEGVTGDDVAAGARTGCARGIDGSLQCWGYNRPVNPLGTAETVEFAPPSPVLSGGVAWTDVESVKAGGDNPRFGGHFCAVQDGAFYCWGRNGLGEVGIGTAPAGVPEPTRISEIGDVLDYALGGRHTCVVESDNAVYCWGNNEFGQLGTGESAASRPRPGDPVVGLRAQRVAAGQNHTCAIDMEGALFCWGAGDMGQLGRGSSTGSAVPVRVDPLVD